MTDIRRIGIVFSGGPAPGANAVIAARLDSVTTPDRELLGVGEPGALSAADLRAFLKQRLW